MKPEWKNFLINHGAEFAGDSLISFGNPERERRIPPQGAILCDLSHFGLISVSGEDAANFLQGQLTNDIRQVTDTFSQLSAYCTPQGRTLATFFITKRQGMYYLSLARDLLEPSLKRLRMYVLRSKVALEDASASLVHFGYAAPDGDKQLADILGKVPANPYDTLQIGNLTVLRQPAAIPRFKVLGELDDARKLWERLNVNAACVGRSSWDYFNISSGIPMVTLASTEAWVPQMMNMHLINGVSFSKGCFPGQEIVARLKYLGKSKRQMYRIGVPGCVTVPAIGTAVSSSADPEAGSILNATRNPDGYVEALAVMKIAQASQPLTLGEYPVQVLELPYALETE
ncbi:folate-binding protein [Candidatus Thiothrix sp. Deng01]|uniref:Folate-binding protein n=1 Tax=Candidatus Thiothrix phosphatis TaxID=3112415 RepID=A0ABU6CXV8_9GAMM|nr:folate-binding protein [Candidatus Thiothrix sp. Deng01]MEB4590902.1 folate-binding protein [Candidatus Thiothrix sp. Deng01]